MLQKEKLIYSRFDFQSNFLFDGLTPREENRVKSYFETMYFSKGNKLFYEDGIPTGVFLIEEGKAKKYKSLVDGQHQIFYIYTSGELLGYHALLSDERYHDSCEALEDITTKFIHKEAFFKLMEEIPTLKNSIIKNMAHEFGVLANTIAILAQKAQNVRLALYLLVLENRFNKDTTSNQGIDLSRQDLANLIGATRESLGRSLKEFKEGKLIEVKSKVIYILDKKGLLSYLEKEA